jgi:uncharacterized protein (UPF0261 family)
MPVLSKCVYAIATLDTKGDEIQFVADCLRTAGGACKIVDVSTYKQNNDVIADVYLADNLDVELNSLDRGAAIAAMGQRLEDFLVSEQQAGRVAGVLGIGGSGGTAIITQAMRALDIGLPKLMVSTVASGNVAAYVDCNDITMMYSVVDVAGLNNVSRQVLSNAAHAIAGMVQHTVSNSKSSQTVGMTMFGVTTAGVTSVRQSLESSGFECLVFHATGTGGRAMERLVESGLIHGVLDITTTEVADEVVGGVFPAGAERFDRILAAKIPYVLSLGALDMVNFGAIDSVPAQFKSRKLHVHNSQVTLMRTSVEENLLIGKWIADKLNRAVSPFTLLIPLMGVSALDREGGVFHDPLADEALFRTLRTHIQTSEQRRILELPYHINEPEFAAALVREYLTLAGGRNSS